MDNIEPADARTEGWIANIIDKLVTFAEDPALDNLSFESRRNFAELVRSIYGSGELEMPEPIRNAILDRISAEVKDQPSLYNPEGDNDYPEFAHHRHPEYLHGIAYVAAPEPTRLKVWSHFNKENPANA